jgi:methionine aminotransferase
MPGVLQLRQVISEKIFNISGCHYDPESEITVTAGATQALFTAITALVNKDDEVIIFEPAYDSYAPSVQLNGGIPVFIPLIKPGYRIDFERLRNSITPRTKLIIINSPHNPTGSILTKNDLEQLEEITRNSSVFFISDEVYEHITFDDKKHISIAGSPELRNRSFIISSFGKTFHTTGWKIGYCSAPANLMAEFRKIHQFIVFAVNTPIQYAYAEYLKNPQTYLGLNSFYQKKRDLFLKAISGSMFKNIPAEGTYFQLLDYSQISDLGDKDFANLLITKYGIAVIPLTPFYSEQVTYADKVIRICFAKKDDVLVTAGDILRSIGSGQ